MEEIEDDLKILEKYKDGRDIDPGDFSKVNELASIGLMKKGLSIRRKKSTAKTTPLGRKLISR